MGNEYKYPIKTTINVFQVQLLRKELDNGRQHYFHVINNLKNGVKNQKSIANEDYKI